MGTRLFRHFHLFSFPRPHVYHYYTMPNAGHVECSFGNEMPEDIIPKDFE